MERFDLALVPQPKPLTKDEHDRAVRDAVALQQDLRAAQRKGREAWWELAKALHAIDEAAAWQMLGHERQADWLEDEGLSYRTYRRLVDAWQELVVIRKIDPAALPGLDPSKVDIVVPALKAGIVATTKALEDIDALTWRELRKAYTPQLPDIEAPTLAPAHPRPTIEPAAPVRLVPAEPEAEPDSVEPQRPPIAELIANARTVARTRDVEAIRAALIELAGATDSDFALGSALLDLVRCIEAEGAM